ncbi:NAD-dependent epimerase/dehydratase family protein [Streptomyces sp. DW26H14]|uniref:NAD-dependent epimerase/dehydratase family protein n=1 Tax=Streptomyces sp. DW26H14 TaxID=3435395 RepID=UPI00403DB15D
MSNTIVVTGANGVMGTYVASRFADEGHEVVGVDLRYDGTPAPGVRRVTADIRDTGTMIRLFQGAQAVIHCATALPSYSTPQIRSTVVGGTRSVLDAALKTSVPRVIHTSSTAVYGLPQVIPTPESYGHRPVDPYSRAKAEAEAVCEEFRDLGQCVTILRPKTFLGEGRMGIFAMLFDWAEAGHNFPLLGGGHVRNQLLSVSDLTDALALALRADEDAANDTYNIGAERFGTLREDFQAVLDRAGHGKHIVGIPVRPAVAVLSVLDRAHLSPVYHRLIHKLLSDSWADTTHARLRLGFAPKDSGTDALLQAYDWYRARRAEDRLPSATGTTHGAPWSQGALRLAKILF